MSWFANNSLAPLEKIFVEAFADLLVVDHFTVVKGRLDDLHEAFDYPILQPNSSSLVLYFLFIIKGLIFKRIWQGLSMVTYRLP